MHPALLILAFVLHLIAGFLVVVGGLIMPAWAVAVLGVVWFALLALGVVKRREPWLVFAMPIVSMVLWFAAAIVGDAFLDWTA